MTWNSSNKKKELGVEFKYYGYRSIKMNSSFLLWIWSILIVNSVPRSRNTDKDLRETKADMLEIDFIISVFLNKIYYY